MGDHRAEQLRVLETGISKGEFTSDLGRWIRSNDFTEPGFNEMGYCSRNLMPIDLATKCTIVTPEGRCMVRIFFYGWEGKQSECNENIATRGGSDGMVAITCGKVEGDRADGCPPHLRCFDNCLVVCFTRKRMFSNIVWEILFVTVWFVRVRVIVINVRGIFYNCYGN